MHFTFISALKKASHYPFKKLTSNSSMKDQVGFLYQQSEELKFLQKAYVELSKENNFLRKSLALKEKLSKNYISAEVLPRFQSFRNLVFINKGRLDGVELEMLVISHQGVVGKVISVSENLSQVLLILDPKCQFSVKIEGLNVSALIKGNESIISPFLSLINLPKGLASLKGRKIYLKKYHFLIGAVKDYHETFFDAQARVIPEVNFDKLNIVFLIKQ